MFEHLLGNRLGQALLSIIEDRFEDAPVRRTNEDSDLVVAGFPVLLARGHQRCHAPCYTEELDRCRCRSYTHLHEHDERMEAGGHASPAQALGPLQGEPRVRQGGLDSPSDASGAGALSGTAQARKEPSGANSVGAIGFSGLVGQR